jgi:hypothetical protein
MKMMHVLLLNREVVVKDLDNIRQSFQSLETWELNYPLKSGLCTSGKRSCSVNHGMVN